MYLYSKWEDSDSDSFSLRKGRLLVCLSKVREDKEGARPRSQADMFINPDVTVMKAKGTFIHFDHLIEAESKLSIWL